jgi:ankyrin repeat protein
MHTKPLPPRPNLEQYKKQAKDLVKAFKSGDPETIRRLRQNHPRLPGRPNTNDRNKVTDSEIRAARLSLADAQFVIAREHQFESWPKFAKCIKALNAKDSPASQFEAAVDAIVTGNITTLKRLLRENPKLIQARSTREHQATLLHYVGANSVEGYHQKTPQNAVQVAEVLLKAGAVVDADLDYGSMRKRYAGRIGSTTLGLVATSVHPAKAGVQIQLLEILLDHGASVDGLPGRWNPLIAALQNGRGDAARFLAERGARLDLEGAAGTGRLDAVKSFFDKNGNLKANATKTQMESGFIWACQYGHVSVVAFLLDHGVEVDAQPHGATGLHWAAYGGHPEIVKLLLKRKASVRIKDRRFGATLVRWALEGWFYPFPEARHARYHEVVALLVAAGAQPDAAWMADNLEHAEIEKLRADPRMLKALAGDIVQ